MENIIQPKKSFFKRWWAWAIIIVLILVGIGYGKDYFDNHKGEKIQDYAKNVVTNSDNQQKFESRIIKTFIPESGAAFKYNSPTIISDYLYIGTSQKFSYEGDHSAALASLPNNFFYKMDLDLNVIWKYPLEKTMVVGSASLDSMGNIYFATELFTAGNSTADKESFFLGTLNLVSLTNDGKLRWQKPFSPPNEKMDHVMFNPTIGTDDTIYIGHDKFYAFDIDGNIKWQYPKNEPFIIGFSSSAIIDNTGNVFFVSPEPSNQEYGTETIRAYKFTPNSNGIPVWSTILGNELKQGEGPTKIGGEKVGGNDLQRAKQTVSIPALGVGGKSLYAMVGCTANKVDTETGELLWSMKPEGATGGFIASPAIDDKDNLYVGTKSNLESTLFAVSSTGKLLWKNLIGADLYSSPLLADDGMIYTGSETTDKGKYYKIDIKTGQIKWAIGKSLSDLTLDSGALYKGYVYIGVHEKPEGNGQPEKTLFKIKVDANGYLQGAGWPRFHGGNANNGRKE